MKYNPRINERVAAYPGFAHVHPYQDEADVQGLLELLYRQYIPDAHIIGKIVVGNIPLDKIEV